MELLRVSDRIIKLQVESSVSKNKVKHMERSSLTCIMKGWKLSAGTLG